MRKPITIPQPKVRPGDRVMAENYRMKDKEHERGTVNAAGCDIFLHGTHKRWVARWWYRVLLDRGMTRTSRYEQSRPTVIFLTVTDDQVFPVLPDKRKRNAR